MKTIYIASIHGIENKGGLERVCQYLYEILSEHYKVKIIKGRDKPYKHGNWLLQSLFISLKLFFIPNKIVIGNSWHSFLYPCDFSIHHGTMYGIDVHLNNGNRTKYSKRIAKMEQISAIMAKKVLPVGENCKKELIEYYNIPEKKIFVLNNFVNDSLFIPKVLSKPANNNIKILFSGRLEKRKGLQELKDLSDYIENKEGFELFIACNNANNTDLFKTNSKTHIQVGLTPDKMPDFYNSGDIMYFPTHYEGFSMSTLEALSCGIPVIGTTWAIGKELQHYSFTKIIDDDKNIENILCDIKNLYKQYKDKKQEIHNEISKAFGRKQYEEKLLCLIKKC